MPGTFKPMWIGLHWPSQPFGDEEVGGSDFDADEGAAVAGRDRRDVSRSPWPRTPRRSRCCARSSQAHQKDAAARDLPADAAQAYSALAKLAGHTSEGPSGPPDADGAPFDPQVAFETGNAVAGTDFAGGGLLGGILGPLRQLSYWTMKKRARSIGESGMHDVVARMMNAATQARVHLMGHSFGCIVMSSIVGGPEARQSLPRAVDSLALIQGAVSLWAFGDEVHGEARTGLLQPVDPPHRGPRSHHRLAIHPRQGRRHALSVGVRGVVFRRRVRA